MSTETKHTPGPWTSREKDRYDLGQIIGADGSVVCGFGSCHEDDEYGSSGVPPGDADLALLLAAPELLEALAELLSISESDGDEWNGSGRLDDALDDARAAIAKAKGEMK